MRKDFRICDFTRELRKGQIIIDTSTLCLAIGNNHIPLEQGENLGTQVKRLIQEIRKFNPFITIYILGLLPRCCDEQQFEPMVKAANDQLSVACRDLRRLQGVKCNFLGIAKLFLEKLKYLDESKQWCFKTRIIRPISQFFQEDIGCLNNVGAEFVKSFLLDRLVKDACPWKAIPVVCEDAGEDEGMSSEGDSGSGPESSEQESEHGNSQESSVESSQESRDGEEPVNMDISPQ